MNAFGQLTPGSTSGNAFGLQVVVDRNFASGTLIVGDASATKSSSSRRARSRSTTRRRSPARSHGAATSPRSMIDASKFVKAAFV
jgi:hypothetical protein